MKLEDLVVEVDQDCVPPGRDERRGYRRPSPFGGTGGKIVSDDRLFRRHVDIPCELGRHFCRRGRRHHRSPCSAGPGNASASLPGVPAAVLRPARIIPQASAADSRHAGRPAPAPPACPARSQARLGPRQAASADTPVIAGVISTADAARQPATGTSGRSARRRPSRPAPEAAGAQWPGPGAGPIRPGR
jgi:hypothetical protein